MRTAGFVALGAVFVLANLFGCGSNGGVAPGSDVDAGPGGIDAGVSADDAGANTVYSTVTANLQVAPGVTLAGVNWTVTNPALLPSDRTGSVDLSNSQAVEFVVGGLPVGPGYTISVTGIASPSGLACMGSASFSVEPNATTTVTITLVCTIPNEAGATGSVSVNCTTVIAPVCAVVTELSASPSEVNLGGPIQLNAMGLDSQSNASDVSISWSVTGGTGSGTFTSESGTSTTFTCATAGPVTVTATASAATAPDASSCQNNTASLTLTCDGKKVSALAVSPQNHVCALIGDGTVECWGSNEAGQLGNGSTDSSLTPVRVQNLAGATAVVTGEAHSCALLGNGTVECWGDQSMLGTGADSGLDDCGLPCSMTPVPVVGLSGVTAIAAGSTHTCALLAGGTVACWGDNLSGELGDGTMNNQLAPVAVASVAGVTAISAGDSDTCALLTGGTIECWGYNYSGQLGNGKTGPNTCSGFPCSLTPVTVVGLSNVKSVVCGGSHTCALLSDSTVDCWGFNDVGELGNGSITSSLIPVPVSNLTGVVALASGTFHSCALLSSGIVECWGDNSLGNFCNGSTTTSPVPLPVPSLAGASEISLGQYDTCAVLAGGSVGCCGQNTQGQLGDGTVDNSSTPVPVGL